MMSANHHPRDLLAFDKISVTQPFWRGFETAKSQIGIEENVFLHAGPAFTTVDGICQPIINSAAVGAVFEGLAKSLDDAVNMVRSGEIILKPAQDHNVVTPLAAVVTPNMPLHYVYDGNHGNHYCLTPINGGTGPAIRLGQKSYEAVEHLRWINGPMLDFMASSLGEGIELIQIASHGLSEGDDCHGRTIAATKQLFEELKSRVQSGIVSSEIADFFQKSPSMFLNLWMAATKTIMLAAVGIAGSSLITAMGGNGIRMGLQIAGLPGRWFTELASPPNGEIQENLSLDRRLGAIGDSAVVEALGLGAMQISSAPEQLKVFKSVLPVNYQARSDFLKMDNHYDFNKATPKIGIAIRSINNFESGPLVALGIIDRAGDLGRIGGGIYDPPLKLFKSAIDALDLSHEH